MAQPIWTTPAGDLGRVAEGLYFSTPLIAIDPSGDSVYYRLIAGALPDGVQVKTNGHLEGTPRATVKVSGVPSPVGADITTKFAVRAYTVVSGAVSRVNDRTFEITVTGQDLPVFVTPAGLLGTYYDGSVVSIPIEFTDTDPGDTVVVSLASGQLPAGLSVLPTGEIVGYIEPVAELSTTAIAGWDRDDTFWDEFPYDFSTRSTNKYYQFSLQITDGKDINIREFLIYAISKDSTTADSTEFTVDYEFITADTRPERKPFLLDFDEVTNDIGTYRHNNWFAYKFNALDLDGEPIAYTIIPSASGLPAGLSIDSSTGWFYGHITDVGIAEYTYEFDVQVYRVNDPTIVSSTYTFTITIVGGVEDQVTWLSDDYLGDIDTGATSMFSVAAETKSGRDIRYRLKTGGVYQRLPQGLQLLESGNIIGRVTFNTFTLDNGTTTFDNELTTRLKIDKTTFDMDYRFTVEAYTDDELLVVNKTFTIGVKRALDGNISEPHTSLYINAMPSLSDRAIINQLLTDEDIIPRDLVYRIDDPEFGVATGVQYTHAYGIKAASLETFVSSLEFNHYRKSLVLGQIRTARALDNHGNNVYDVVYADIVDTGVNDSDIPDYSLAWSVPINYNESTVTTVYPNSLPAMRDRVIDLVDQYESTLPLWMLSKQESGQIPFFVKCWPIVYCKPGKGKQVLYNIQQQFGTRLNQVDFEVDRWIIDGQLTKNWEPYDDSTISGRWTLPELTTFDTLATTFDENSLRFLSPVDLAGKTDQHDKYIMFPRTNILG